MRPRAARATGWALVGLTAALCVWAVTSAAAGSYRAPFASPEIVGLAVVISLASATIGALILSRRPDNGIGWLFAVAAPVTAGTIALGALGDRALTANPTALDGRLAAWATDLLNPLSFAMLTVFLFLLFPDGRLRRRRAERRTAALAAAATALATIGAAVEPVLQSYPDIEPPLAPFVPGWLAWGLIGIGIVVLLGTIVASVALLVGRLRASVGRERDQVRLLLWAAAVATALLVPATLLPPSAPDAWQRAVYAFGGLGFLLIPVSVGVAILRHRLFDIDLVIRRTVIVAVLGAFITVVYLGIVVGVGTLVGNRTSPVLSAAAAAVVALAFQPVRRGAQRLANRFVYGERATPYEVLSTLASRMGETYAAGDLLPRIARVVAEGTGAERTTVWLRVGDELRSTATWPAADRTQPSAAISADGPPDLPADHVVAVQHRGELLGAISLDKPTGEALTPTEEKLLHDVASQSGLALRNVRLTEELRATIDDLRASRRRLVEAQDDERRKLERDIHDGAQQQLVALAVKIRMADAMVDPDPEHAHAVLAQAQAEAQEALEELRDLARGIFPPLLADRGLPSALEAQARKSLVPAEVRAADVGRYAKEIETTVYFCCLEALQNIAKYAGASRAEITLLATDGELRFEVRDDGRGFDPGRVASGSGLQNMADRLDAVGGSLEVTSAPGAGTTLAGTIPVPATGP